MAGRSLSTGEADMAGGGGGGGSYVIGHVYSAVTPAECCAVPCCPPGQRQ